MENLEMWLEWENEVDWGGLKRGGGLGMRRRGRR